MCGCNDFWYNTSGIQALTQIKYLFFLKHLYQLEDLIVVLEYNFIIYSLKVYGEMICLFMYPIHQPILILSFI